MNKKVQTHIPYGFITALAMIVLFAILEVAKLSENKGVQFIGWIVFLGGLILNARAFSKANDADITFGQAFGSCFKASAIIAIVLFAWTFIMFMVFPSMETRILDKAQEGMMNGKMSEEQVDKAMTMTRKFFKIFAAGGTLIFTLIEGAIFSLIAAAIAKKQPRQQIMMQ